MVAPGADGTGCSVKKDAAIQVLIQGFEYFMPKCSVVVLKEGLPRALEYFSIVENDAV